MANKCLGVHLCHLSSSSINTKMRHHIKDVSLKKLLWVTSAKTNHSFKLQSCMLMVKACGFWVWVVPSCILRFPSKHSSMVLDGQCLTRQNIHLIKHKSKKRNLVSVLSQTAGMENLCWAWTVALYSHQFRQHACLKWCFNPDAEQADVHLCHSKSCWFSGFSADFFSDGLEKDVNEIRDIVEIYFYFYPFSNLTVHFLTEIKIHTMNKIEFNTKEATNIFKGWMINCFRDIITIHISTGSISKTTHAFSDIHTRYALHMLCELPAD